VSTGASASPPGGRCELWRRARGALALRPAGTGMAFGHGPLGHGRQPAIARENRNVVSSLGEPCDLDRLHRSNLAETARRQQRF
jgi:hypothetical protein